MTVVQQAIHCFKQGQYEQAKKHYQQAADQYGAHLFATSIRVCDTRLGLAVKAVEGQVVNAETQLIETQRLLEHYYGAYQKLKNESQDNK